MSTASTAGKGSKRKTGVSTDETFSIETHGIDRIPLTERHGQPRELFWVWLGSNCIFTYIIIGAALMSFGVSVAAAIVAVVAANVLFYLLAAYGSVTGPTTGTATLAVSRAAYGRFGVIPSAFVNWLNVVGFVAVNAVVGTLALYEIALKVSLPSGTALKAICLALVLVVTFLVCIWGHATLVLMQTVLSYALGLGAIVLAIYILPHMTTTSSPRLPGTSAVGAFLLAFFLVASGPLSYIAVGADFSRYLPPAVQSRAVAGWSALGAIIPAVVLGLIGVAAATQTNMTDPIGGIGKLVPNWFLVPFLAVIVGGSITNNFISLYSSGLGLQTMGVPWSRARTIWVDATIATAASIYAVFVHDFTATFVEFLSLLVLWAAPWGGIYVTDILLRRNTYDSVALHDHHGGTYWYERGWNARGLIALAIGIIAAAMFSNSTLWQGPLVKVVGGGDLSVEVGFFVSAIVYYALMRSTITEQTRRVDHEAPNDPVIPTIPESAV